VAVHLNDDEQMLADLGYKQELNRSWSGFSNFAISFSIISILAGCFTTFAVGWNNGGPAAIAFGWPIVSAFILLVGFCMSELVSAYPTSGGIYWWASKLGGAKAGYYTGWLNLIGLLAIDASVAYGTATFLDLTIGAFDSGYTVGDLNRIFLYFAVVLVMVSLVNIFSSRLLARLNNISVWWHVAGAALIILILWLVPEQHSSASTVFGTLVNNVGFFGGSTSGAGFLLYVLPISAILTQYTITGYDASAHLSEETQGAANSAAKGIWRSIFYSALGGWVLLLTFLFAVQDVDGVSAGGGAVVTIFNQALPDGKWAAIILFISTAGQFFCTTACMTSTSRMLFAFSRDGAVPGARHWAKLSANRVPVNGVVLSAVIAILLTLPALFKVNIGTPQEPVYVPIAFFAVVSIGVVGLYVAFAIPIFLRWRAGTTFRQGSWNLGSKWRWMAPLAVAEIVVTSIVALFPTAPAGNPFSPDFSWKAVNYTPIVVIGALLALWVGWHLSAKKWFTGPRTTVEAPRGGTAADEVPIEHQGGTSHPGQGHAVEPVDPLG
jgi:amino acid transporter